MKGMSYNKKLMYNKEKDVWYLVSIYNPTTNTNSHQLNEKKEIIFMGDNRHYRDKLDDLIELIFMQDGYSNYYIQIIVKMIMESK